MEIRDRRLILKNTALDLGGARLQFHGAYALAGGLDLNVRADLRRLRRRWLERDDDLFPSAGWAEFRLGGPIDHLVVNPQVGVAEGGRQNAAGCC
jgi:hypothetical protein